MVEIPDDVAREIGEFLRDYHQETWADLLDSPKPPLVDRMLTAWYGDEGNPRATDRTSMAAALAVVRADVEELPSWPSIKVHELLALLDGGDK